MLDSVDGRALPALTADNGIAGRTYTSQLLVLLESGDNLPARYAASERDSIARPNGTYDTVTVAYGGLYHLHADVASVGPDSIELTSFSATPGRILSADEFTQMSAHGVLHFRRVR